jgi:hypothetical protein
MLEKGPTMCDARVYAGVRFLSFIYNVLHYGWRLERLGYEIKISLFIGCSDDT